MPERLPELPIGGDEPASLASCQGHVQAVVEAPTKAMCDLPGGLEQQVGRMDGQRHAPEIPHEACHRVRRKLALAPLLPEDVPDLGPNQVRSPEIQAATEQPAGSLRV